MKVAQALVLEEFPSRTKDSHTLPLWYKYQTALESSNSLGETNSVATEVVNRVVLAKEHIT